MIEWFPENMTLKEKRDFYLNIPNEIKIRLYVLELLYGMCCVKIDEGNYKIYYIKNGELIKDEIR